MAPAVPGCTSSQALRCTYEAPRQAIPRLHRRSGTVGRCVAPRLEKDPSNNGSALACGQRGLLEAEVAGVQVACSSGSSCPGTLELAPEPGSVGGRRRGLAAAPGAGVRSAFNALFSARDTSPSAVWAGANRGFTGPVDAAGRAMYFVVSSAGKPPPDPVLPTPFVNGIGWPRLLANHSHRPRPLPLALPPNRDATASVPRTPVHEYGLALEGRDGITYIHVRVCVCSLGCSMTSGLLQSFARALSLAIDADPPSRPHKVPGRRSVDAAASLLASRRRIPRSGAKARDSWPP